MRSCDALPFPHRADPDARLATARLALEPVRQSHAPLVYALWQDDAIYRFVPEDAPASLEALTARFARLETRESAAGDQAWLQWMIRRLDDDVYVGRAEATLVEGDRAFIAWMFASAHWGRGYARETMQRVIERLVADCGVRTIEVEIDARNTRSIALAAALGFVETAWVRDADFFKGSTSHEVHMTLRVAG